MTLMCKCKGGGVKMALACNSPYVEALSDVMKVFHVCPPFLLLFSLLSHWERLTSRARPNKITLYLIKATLECISYLSLQRNYPPCLNPLIAGGGGGGGA